jgi:16S rRNA (guanine(966)-N(2))-methyltransferase RsmD
MSKDMRIIAGKYRSRLIEMPRRPLIRPTKDRVREALFNILGRFVIDATVMDAFAGSGAFGLEALSRGAKKVIFVERDMRCLRAIRTNLSNLSIEKSFFEIMKLDVFDALRVLQKKGIIFSLVLLDPPYHKDIAKKCLIKLDSHDILSQPCIIVAEHHKKDEVPEALNKIIRYRKATYGDVQLSFYKRI